MSRHQGVPRNHEGFRMLCSYYRCRLWSVGWNRKGLLVCAAHQRLERARLAAAQARARARRPAVG